MSLTAHQKKIVVLSRLTDGDRIVRQKQGTYGTDAAWFLRRPQSQVHPSTFKWLERHGLIMNSIAPVSGDDPYGGRPIDESRRAAQSVHGIFAITPRGYDWFLDNS